MWPREGNGHFGRGKRRQGKRTPCRWRRKRTRPRPESISSVKTHRGRIQEGSGARLGCVGKTNLLGPRITTFRTSGFGVETVEYKNLSFTMWNIGGHEKVRSLWRHFYQVTNGLIYVVNSNHRNKVVDARRAQQTDRR